MKQDRINGTKLVLPIVLGSISFYMGKKSPGEHSHKWTIYVRSIDGYDLSFLLDKVVFTLHPSCSKPVVVVEKPPFQVSQTGWGEFEATITFHFKEGLENPVTNVHFLRLFPEGVTSAGPNTSTTIPVVSEIYDEFLFVNPPTKLHELLTSGDYLKVPEVGFEEMKEWFKDFDEETTKCLAKMRDANSFIKKEIKNILSQANFSPAK